MVEPLGTADLMPAILVGFANPPGTRLRWQGLRSDVPPYVVEVLQQAGGYAMSYPEAVGVLLRLEANAAHALQDPSRLIRGFHCMAEDPDYRVLRREYPEMKALCGTRGQTYTEDELRVLDSALSAFFRLPGSARGLEAFVELEHCDLLTFFDGWQMVEVRRNVEEIVGPQRSPGELWWDGARLTERTLVQLRDLGREVGIDQPMQAVLLWENSD